MSKKAFLCVLMILYAMFVTSCKRDHYKVDVSSIKLDLTISRLEKDLFTLDPGEVEKSVPLLLEKYGRALQAFSYAINAGETGDTAFNGLLTSFCTDRLNNEVYSKVVEMYPDITNIESGLGEAFRHYLYYFPSRELPQVFTCITGFNRGVITVAGEHVLGIGLDMYLGRDCEYYKQLGIYNYLTSRMDPVNIIPDCIYALGVRDWEFEEMGYDKDNVFSRIIHEGKLKYFEKSMLPELNDSVLFGFTGDQMTFCRNNETPMWQYLIEHDLLYSTDQLVIRKLTGEGPFTSYFSTESPGKAAIWTGFRIVESYMRKNPSVTLEELMKDIDYQRILEEARYNPQ